MFSPGSEGHPASSLSALEGRRAATVFFQVSSDGGGSSFGLCPAGTLPLQILIFLWRDCPRGAGVGEILQLLHKRPAPSALSLGSPLSSFCPQLPSHIGEIAAGLGNRPNKFPLTLGSLLRGGDQRSLQYEVYFFLGLGGPQQSPPREREIVGGIAPPCNNLPNVRGKLSAEGGERAPKRQRRGSRTLVLVSR